MHGKWFYYRNLLEINKKSIFSDQEFIKVLLKR